MSDKRTKGIGMLEVRRDSKDHYPLDGIFVEQVNSETARTVYDYPGPTISSIARDLGMELKPGDEVKLTLEVVSRVFTERRKP